MLREKIDNSNKNTRNILISHVWSRFERKNKTPHYAVTSALPNEFSPERCIYSLTDDQL